MYRRHGDKLAIVFLGCDLAVTTAAWFGAYFLRFTLFAAPDGVPHLRTVAQALPLTLTLVQGINTYTYNVTTDPYGYFTVDVNNLADGTYTWRVKGSKYLSTSGSIVLRRSGITAAEGCAGPTASVAKRSALRFFIVTRL